jgi:hypothetical protein
VNSLAADPVVTGKDGSRNTAAGTLDALRGPFRCDGLLPPFVGAALLGQGEAFPLASLMRQRSDPAKAPMMESMRFRLIGR